MLESQKHPIPLDRFPSQRGPGQVFVVLCGPLRAQRRHTPSRVHILKFGRKPTFDSKSLERTHFPSVEGTGTRPDYLSDRADKTIEGPLQCGPLWETNWTKWRGNRCRVSGGGVDAEGMRGIVRDHLLSRAVGIPLTLRENLRRGVHWYHV